MTTTPQSARLTELLLAHGVSGSSVSAASAWAAFKVYGREVFASEGVGILFQLGVYDFSGEPLFYFDPVCQYEQLDDEGEHDHFEQLHCEMACQPNESLRNVSAELWSFQYSTPDDYFAAVESLPDFKLALEQTGYVLNVYHEDV